jgi:hypothetical protein
MSTIIKAAMVGSVGLMTLLGCGAPQQPGAAPAGPASSGQQPSESTSSAAGAEGAPQQGSMGAAPECVDDKDQPVECLSDADCCSGFVCGRDPELSRRVRYCIYGG